ncbi:MAG: alanine racemase [Oscillospiraceae bacterium]
MQSLHMTFERRAWAEIDLDALESNFRLIGTLAGSALPMAVIKADAYGHGATALAPELAALGARCFAVATPDEAFSLRRSGISQPILVLGVAPPELVPTLAAQKIMLSVGDLSVAKQYAAALGENTVDVHLAIDTGMCRLGLGAVRDLPQAVDDALAIAALEPLCIVGAFTHFAVADTPSEDAYTNAQFSCFIHFRRALSARGLSIPMWHCANSAALLRFPAMQLDAVRPGILLYGASPDRSLPLHIPLTPVMSLRTIVTQLKTMNSGETVSYGRMWKADQPRRIATLAIGYADGLPRIASGKFDMLVHGRRAPQVGRICMDMCMLDVTEIPGVALGDVVTVFGCDGTETLSADVLAQAAQTVSYEIFCGISQRIPRYYVRSEMSQ